MYNGQKKGRSQHELAERQVKLAFKRHIELYGGNFISQLQT